MEKLDINNKIVIHGITYYFYVRNVHFNQYYKETVFYTEKEKIKDWSFDFKKFKIVTKYYYKPIDLFTLDFDINDPIYSKETVRKLIEEKHKIELRKNEIKLGNYI